MVKLRNAETQFYVQLGLLHRGLFWPHRTKCDPRAFVPAILSVIPSASGMLCSKDADLIGHVVV